MHGLATPIISVSWNASFPIITNGTCPVTAIIGEESAYAVAIPVIRLVAPGPDVAKQTPAFLFILA